MVPDEINFMLDPRLGRQILSCMARPLRIKIAGGHYHVTARGNERREIFRQDRDRVHFLELLAQWPARFGANLYAYVLMDNHYHLLVETSEANLSRLEQWLNTGEKWSHFPARHGDWGRDEALWLGRHAGRMRLAELAREIGCDYTTVGKAVSRFGQRLKRDPILAKTMSKLKQKCEA